MIRQGAKTTEEFRLFIGRKRKDDSVLLSLKLAVHMGDLLKFSILSEFA